MKPLVKNKVEAPKIVGPIVDTSEILKLGESYYLSDDVVDFSQYKKARSNKQKRKLEPPEILIDTTATKLSAEPECDVNPALPRFKLPPVKYSELSRKHFGYSIAAHFVLVLIGFLLSLIAPSTFNLDDEAIPVTMVFGTTDKDVAAKEIAGATEEAPEATKVKETLPQLAKSIAVESKDPPPKDAMPPPDESRVKELPKESVLIPTPPPAVRTISAEEMAKRIEKENRKVGNETKDGKQDTADKGKKDLKYVPTLPPDPFSASNIPSAPPGLQGSVEGRVHAGARSSYEIKASGHLKRYWTVPNLVKFDPNIKAQLRFVVNRFGKIVGAVTVTKSSGDPEFDDQAIQGVRSAEPFPEFPAELPSTMTLNISLQPKDSR